MAMEDLEQHELLASARAPALIEGSSSAARAGRRRKDTTESELPLPGSTADDAKPSTNKPPSVLGVFIVATKPIAAGASLSWSPTDGSSGPAGRSARQGSAISRVPPTSSSRRQLNQLSTTPSMREL